MLKQRVVTALFALVIVFVVLLWGPTPWKALVYVTCLLCVSEFSGVTGQRWYTLPSILAYLLVTLEMWFPEWKSAIGFQCVVAVTLLLPVVLRNRITIFQTASLLVGALYIGFGGASIGTLRDIGPGWAWLLVFLVSIWATDTVAYFAGSWLKGPKLWPSISPKKTLSGAIAGLLGAGIAATVVGVLTLNQYAPIGFFLLGLVVSALGQLGDLVESAYKRSAGIKDSGKILPGHGGILDRVDSLLFAAPFTVYFITVVGPHWMV